MSMTPWTKSRQNSPNHPQIKWMLCFLSGVLLYCLGWPWTPGLRSSSRLKLLSTRTKNVCLYTHRCKCFWTETEMKVWETCVSVESSHKEMAQSLMFKVAQAHGTPGQCHGYTLVPSTLLPLCSWGHKDWAKWFIQVSRAEEAAWRFEPRQYDSWVYLVPVHLVTVLFRGGGSLSET